MEEKEENRIPAWLKNLQENSWELELLVSGGAIFSLLQLADLFIDWTYSLIITSAIGQFRIILIAGMLGIKILTIGFILHLILRAFWLGLVCVNYVFPTGIIGEKLKQQKPFFSKETDGDLKDQIMRVDNLCGTMMFTSIISAVVITGLTLLIAIVAFIGIYLENNFDSFFINFSRVIIVFSVMFYLLDLLLMGLLRKIKLVSYILYPFFKTFDFLSFRFVYQRALNLFSSNVKKIRFFFAATIFILAALMSTYMSLYRTMHWPNVFDSREFKWQLAEGAEINYRNYRDQLEPDERSKFSIQSKIIENNYLDVFVLYQRWDDNLIKDSHETDSLQNFGRVVAVEIDDSLYSNITWHTTWNKDITHQGISTMIPIHHLQNGQHNLKLFTICDCKTEEEKLLRRYQEAMIPFWKDVN